MYCTVVLVAAYLTIAAANSMNECLRLSHPASVQCCKKERLDHISDFKECFLLPHEQPPSCDIFICVAKKQGIISDDGVIDYKKKEAQIEKDYEYDSKLVEKIKAECLHGDISKYGPLRVCDLLKVESCIRLHFMLSCSEWDDQDTCMDVKELAEECAVK